MRKLILPLVAMLLSFSLAGCCEKVVYVQPDIPLLQTIDRPEPLNIEYEVIDE